MQSECVGKEEARELRVQAGNANLRSLDICDKLSGVNSDRWVCTLQTTFTVDPLSYSEYSWEAPKYRSEHLIKGNRAVYIRAKFTKMKA